MIGDSYRPAPGTRVILFLKSEQDGYEGDRIQGKVLSYVEWDDVLHMNIHASWGRPTSIPMDRIQAYTNLDTLESHEALAATARRAGLVRKPVTFAEWAASRRSLGGGKPVWRDVDPIGAWDQARHDSAFEAEKADMLGRVDVELVRPPRDPRRSED